MASIKELKDQIKAARDRDEAIFAGSKDRRMTAEEMAESDRLDGEIRELEQELSIQERNAARQRALSERGVLTSAGAGRAVSSSGPFRTFGEQMMAVQRAGMPGATPDPRLLNINAGPSGMSEGVGSDGGFMVQTDFISTLFGSMFDEESGGQILSRINVLPVGPNSNGIRANGVDETSRATGSRWGGIRTFWTPEAGLKLQSQPKFRRIQMELEKLTAILYATDELLADATMLSAWVQNAFQEEMTFALEDAILNGTGAGQPLGILNSGALVTAPKVAGQLAATVNQANIIAMWQRLPTRSRLNAVWLVNQDTETQLYTLFTPVTNGSTVVGGIASQNVVFVPAGVNGSNFPTLMGRPVITVEQAATLGTPGDIMLFDLSAYLGIDKGGMESASSIHVRFIYDETTFRFVYRFNGQPIYAAPLTPYRGTNTLSPFVVLATRS